jgi:D-sedoheptulose 7-phosphate isomerase
MKIKKNDLFLKDISENIAIHQKLVKLNPLIKKAINSIYLNISNGGKVMFCGNGGSAADAQHLTAELLIRLKPKINRRALPAISLAQDTSTITACGNDYSFNNIFVRPFEALANKNDILFVISTSGNSKNILRVLKKAKSKKITTIGLLGNKGGNSKKNCDISIVVPSKITARIQECHIFIGHHILSEVEKKLIRI